jgi:hypothetical protein
MCSICGADHPDEKPIQLTRQWIRLCPWCLWQFRNGIIMQRKRCNRFRFLERTEANCKILSELFCLPTEQFKEDVSVCYPMACDRCKPKDPIVMDLVAKIEYKKYH